MIARIFNRFVYVFWLVGALFPAIYILFASRIKSIFHVAIKDSWIKYLTIFMGIQFITLLLGMRFEFFNLERAIALTHNIATFSMLTLGFVLFQDSKFRSGFKKYSYELFMLVSSFIVVTFIYSLWTKTQLSYGGILSFLGDNKFTEVRINSMENALTSNFPRTSVLAIFPNATAFLMFALHSLMIRLNGEELTFIKKWSSFALLILVLFISGSRLFLFFGLAMSFVSLIKNKRDLSFLLLLSPLFLFIAYELFTFMLSIRPGSNATREILMENSFDFYWKNSPVFGLGIKPKLPEVLEGLTYPIGSHSTYLGYFTKSGLIGGIYFLVLIFSLIYLIIDKNFKWLFKNIPFNKNHFYFLMSSLLIFVAFIFEDLDAYELTAMYCGMMLFELKSILTVNHV